MLPMFFDNSYPYTDFHEMNLSWVINQVKRLEIELKNFVGINTIKYADPIQWDITNQYEANTVVIDANTGIAYISTKPVPSGVAITNTDYWTVVFTLDINKSNENITLRNDGNNANATFESVAGDWVIVTGILYKVNSKIDIGDTYVPNYNIVRYTVELFIKEYITGVLTIIGDLSDLTTSDKDSVVDAINELVTSLTNISNSIGDLSNLTTSDKSSLVNAINEVISTFSTIIGDLATLTTSDKDSVVDAINEVNSNVGDLSTLTTTDKDSAVDAINEVNSNVGDLSNLTTTDKSSIVNAVNELESELSAINPTEWINVKAFGAVGDGVTDDTTAVNSAIAELNTRSRGALYFPPGEYLVGDLTPLLTVCSVFGAGANATAIIPKADTSLLFEITQHFTEIKDLLIKDDNSSTCLCIYAKVGNGVSIHDIKISDVYKFILLGDTTASNHNSYYAEVCNIYGTTRHEFARVNGCKSFVDMHDISVNSEAMYTAAGVVIEPVGTYVDTVKLDNVSFQRYTNAVFISTTSANQHATNIWISNCVFDDIGQRGIYVNNPSGRTADIRSIFIHDTWIALNNTTGITPITCTNFASANLCNIQIVNCELIGATGDANSQAISMRSCKDITIEANNMVEYNEVGVELQDCHQVTIVGNNVGYAEFASSLSAARYGMKLSGCTKMLVTANNLINNKTNAMVESSNTTYRIENNLGAQDTGDNYAIGEVKYRSGGYKYWNGSTWA